MSTTAAQEAENLEIEKTQERINADRNLSKNRRYVGTKETLAYIIYDILSKVSALNFIASSQYLLKKTLFMIYYRQCHTFEVYELRSKI